MDTTSAAPHEANDFIHAHPALVSCCSFFGAGVLFCTVFFGGGTFYSSIRRTEVLSRMTSANALWSAGCPAEACPRYESLIDKDLTFVERSQRPVLFQRVIEFELAQGHVSAARSLAEKAIGKGILVAALDPAVAALFRQLETERKLGANQGPFWAAPREVPRNK